MIMVIWKGDNMIQLDLDQKYLNSGVRHPWTMATNRGSMYGYGRGPFKAEHKRTITHIPKKSRSNFLGGLHCRQQLEENRFKVQTQKFDFVL